MCGRTFVRTRSGTLSARGPAALASGISRYRGQGNLPGSRIAAFQYVEVRSHGVSYVRAQQPLQYGHVACLDQFQHLGVILKGESVKRSFIRQPRAQRLGAETDLAVGIDR